MTTIAMSVVTALNVYFAIEGNEPAFSWAVAAFCGLVTITWAINREGAA